VVGRERGLSSRLPLGGRPAAVAALRLIEAFALGTLPLLQPFDHLTGHPVVAALLKIPTVGFGAERAVGVADPVALAVLLDPADCVPPGPLALDGGR
jgi:hypothetical protein